MSTKTSEATSRLVNDISVRRVPVFGAPGSARRWQYVVSIETALGNAGTFEIPQQTYENDDLFAAWLQEAIFQLDKAHQMTMG